MNNLARLAQLASDCASRGLLYAIANYRIHSPVPLDPVDNWRFWQRAQTSGLDFLGKAYPLEGQRKAYFESMLRQAHEDGIEAHYDVSNEFYALFLDQIYRFYTAADFLSDRETLEQAQEHKANYLRTLLKLRGHEKVLDLGCGWGAMLKFLQDGGHVGPLTGFTLSKEQLIYNQETLGFNVSLRNFITEPFDEGPYDRILSIGAIEHVRPNELQALYEKIYAALAPGGLAVHQFFSFERESYPASGVMVQLFFPGSLLVLHRQHIELAERAGFKITHDSLHNYQPTLKAWYERLAKNRDKALGLVGLEVYNRYMTFFPVAWLFFQTQEARLHRVVMEKPLG